MTNNTDKLEANSQNEAGFDDITLPIASDIRVGNKAVVQNMIRHTTKSMISSPYKFLVPYDLADKELFYGRQKTLKSMAKKIIHHKIVTLSGLAGSGKTSLINAGLIPLLANNGYIYVYFREYSDPLQQLHTYLSQYNFVAEAQFASLINLIQSIKFYESNHIVIFFDQFEYFLTQVSSSKRYTFIKSLQHCFTQPLSADHQIKINFVFILQQDFLGQLLTEFETLLPHLSGQTTHLNLLLLNQNEAHEAIIKPLTHLDVNISYDESQVGCAKCRPRGLIGYETHTAFCLPSIVKWWAMLRFCLPYLAILTLWFFYIFYDLNISQLLIETLSKKGQFLF
ncbi:MAG: ATP-binding protein [Thioploca sp.]|nr:ATP-binding protein [Thioploca sp.]